jgi:hypothetical protein
MLKKNHELDDCVTETLPPGGARVPEVQMALDA